MRLGDLLHIGEPEHADVGHQEAAIGNGSVDLREDQRLGGQVELQEAILTAVVGAPDGVEPVALPGPGKLGERAEGVGGAAGADGCLRLTLGVLEDEVRIGLCDYG